MRNKSDLRQNSAKGPKDPIDPNGAKNDKKKSNIDFQNVQKMPPKSAKLQHYSLSWKKQCTILQRSEHTNIFAHSYLFESLWESQIFHKIIINYINLFFWACS